MRPRSTSIVFLLALCAGCPAPEQPDAGPTTEDAGASRDAGGDAGTDAGLNVPSLLSERGLYEDIAARTLREGVLPYDVRVPLFTDGFDKRRYLWLPPGSVIDTSDMDAWVFPLGTRLYMEIRSGETLIATRVLEKLAEGRRGWSMVSYQWNAEATDAEARPEGVVDANGTSYDILSSAVCFTCHMGQVDVPNGVSALQIAGPGGLLEQLVADGRLSDPPLRLIDWPGTGDARDAVAYLHANCGQCHNDFHPLAMQRTLRFRLSVADTVIESTPVYRTALGADTSHDIGGTVVAIEPGDPAASQVWVRMGLRDLNAMPPVGTEIVDDAGRATIAAWISSL